MKNSIKQAYICSKHNSLWLQNLYSISNNIHLTCIRWKQSLTRTKYMAIPMEWNFWHIIH